MPYRRASVKNPKNSESTVHFYTAEYLFRTGILALNTMHTCALNNLSRIKLPIADDGITRHNFGYPSR